MKHKVLAVLTVAGILGVSGTAFADININIGVDKVKFRPVAKTQKQLPPEPPEGFNGKRPPMSGDRQPPPPKPRSGDMPPHMNQQQMNHPEKPEF